VVLVEGRAQRREESGFGGLFGFRVGNRRFGGERFGQVGEALGLGVAFLGEFLGDAGVRFEFAVLRASRVGLFRECQRSRALESCPLIFYP
jgi:hypothetical protein